MKIRTIKMRLPNQLKRGNRPGAQLSHRGITQPPIINHGNCPVAIVSNIGDVHRIRNDRHIPRTINNQRAKHRRTEVTHSTKVIESRPDVVAGIHPSADPHLWSPFSLRWKRSPAHIILPPPPRNPTGTPLIIWNPAPALTTNRNPSTVVINNSREFFVTYPSPTRVGKRPVPVSIRDPLTIHLRRSPAETIALHLDPFAIRQKSIVKVIE